jgi:hypothetical protein
MDKNIPAYVGGHHQIECIGGIVDEWIGVIAAVDACTIDSKVETPGVAGSNLYRMAHCNLVPYVSDDLYEFDRFFQFHSNATCDGNGASFCCQRESSTRPIPELPPVMRAVFPANCCVVVYVIIIPPCFI